MFFSQLLMFNYFSYCTNFYPNAELEVTIEITTSTAKAKIEAHLVVAKVKFVTSNIINCSM